jgi:hypothetical protein
MALNKQAKDVGLAKEMAKDYATDTGSKKLSRPTGKVNP